MGAESGDRTPTESEQLMTNEPEYIARNRPTPRSGLPLKIHRFVASERFLHWGLAIPFVVLYATAAAMLLLWAEPQPRTAHTVASWIHRIAGVGLIIFPPLALLRGSRDWRVHLGNIREAWVWSANDFRWLLLSPLAAVNDRIRLPEQGRFNAAEKLNFMMVCATYPLYIATGILIWLPGASFVPWLLHLAMAAVGLALVVGHIFMAAVNPSTRSGLEGMITGWVDREWAKHHYRRWFRDTFERKVARRSPRAAAPAAPPAAPSAAPSAAQHASPVVHRTAASGNTAASTEAAPVPRAAPLGESISWSASERGATPEMARTTPIYIRQRVLANLHDHLRSAGNLNVLGFFIGDVCEDPGTQERWIEIKNLVRLTKAAHADKPAAVIAPVWNQLHQEIQRVGGHLLGWYLSHPFGQPELGPDEVAAHQQYFRKPWQMALAIAGGEFGAFYRSQGASAAMTGALPFREVLDRESISADGGKRTRVTWKNYRPDVPLTPIRMPATVAVDGSAEASPAISAPTPAPAPETPAVAAAITEPPAAPSMSGLLRSPAKIRCTTCGEIHSFKSWERLLQRIFQVEPLFCSNCKNELMPAVGRAAPELAEAVLHHLQQNAPDEPLPA